MNELIEGLEKEIEELQKTLWKEFAVAISWMTQPDKHGNSKLFTSLDLIKARSKDEALGESIQKNWKRGNCQTYNVTEVITFNKNKD